MFLKALTGFAQAIIIVLALTLLITITSKHSSTLELESLERKVDASLVSYGKRYDERIKTVQDNLETYQLSREARAKYISERVEEMYAEYKKSKPVTTPLLMPSPEAISSDNPDLKKTIDNNLTYVEGRLNKLSMGLDSLKNQYEGDVSVLRERVKALESENKALKTQSKVINNNNSNAVINVSGADLRRQSKYQY